METRFARMEAAIARVEESQVAHEAAGMGFIPVPDGTEDGIASAVDVPWLIGHVYGVHNFSLARYANLARQRLLELADQSDMRESERAVVAAEKEVQRYTPAHAE